jgi:hypothetical protein
MLGVIAVPSHTRPASTAIDAPMASNVAITTRTLEGGRSISDVALARNGAVIDRVTPRLIFDRSSRIAKQAAPSHDDS